MSVFEKLVDKVFSGRQISYQEAEKLLIKLDFKLTITSSHHVFRKAGYQPIALKKRPQLFAYQINDLKEVFINHGYSEKS